MEPRGISSLGLEHRLHSSFKKSIIEKSIQYFKDRIECFDDDYYPCRYMVVRYIMYTNGHACLCLCKMLQLDIPNSLQ